MKANTIDVVEVMARAIAEADVSPGFTFDELWGDDELRQGYTEQAQAALEAIRSAGYVVVPVEPTEAQIEAAFIAWHESDMETLREDCASVYSAMIDATR